MAYQLIYNDRGSDSVLNKSPLLWTDKRQPLPAVMNNSYKQQMSPVHHTTPPNYSQSFGDTLYPKIHAPIRLQLPGDREFFPHTNPSDVRRSRYQLLSDGQKAEWLKRTKRIYNDPFLTSAEAAHASQAVLESYLPYHVDHGGSMKGANIYF